MRKFKIIFTLFVLIFLLFLYQNRLKRPKNKRIIAFSYFGSKEKYLVGLLKNLKAIPEIYGSNYTIRIYTDSLIKEVENYSNIEIVLVQDVKVFGIPLKGW